MLTPGILGEIYEKCKICKEYAKTPARPEVGLPMASKFNEKVAMDLKSWKEKWIPMPTNAGLNRRPTDPALKKMIFT